MFIYLFPYLFLYEVLATINVLDSGVLPLEKDSVGIQFFLDIENEDRINSCVFRTWTKKCCLTDSEKEDCNTMFVYGVNVGHVKPKDRETLIYVYPTIHQHDQVGYCDFFLDYKCGKKSLRYREVINIPFDTRISNKKLPKDFLLSYIVDQKSKECDTIDQDSLDNCEPINCDLKYSSCRPYFNYNLQRCVEAAICEGDPDKKLPDIVYVPTSNVCRDLENPLTSQDVFSISKGFYSTTESLRVKNEVKVQLKSNCTTVSQNLKLLKDLMSGKLCPIEKGDTSDYGNCCVTAILKILYSIAGICAFLIAFICCVNITSWLHVKWSKGAIKKCWRDFKKKFRKRKEPSRDLEYRRIDPQIRNSLLREVIVKDVPLELRDNIVDICDRMDKEVRWKKRYRREDMGSQVSLVDGKETNVHYLNSSSTSSLEDCHETVKLLQ